MLLGSCLALRNFYAPLVLSKLPAWVWTTRAKHDPVKILPWKCAFSLIEAAKYWLDEVEKLVRGNAKPRRNAEVEGCRLLKWRSWTNEANFFDRAITTTWSALFYYLQHGELPIVMKDHSTGSLVKEIVSSEWDIVRAKWIKIFQGDAFFLRGNRLLFRLGHGQFS